MTPAGWFDKWQAQAAAARKPANRYRQFKYPGRGDRRAQRVDSVISGR